ncbi:Small-subunit processome [Babesia duncani]|uniref:Small-subunit processome n=1 Tax=Babesia duncani TaxID=323732 RepID=A0AAD9PJG0_9APIC|nr:Small-subunit processome [Babesia duncani]
MKEMGKGGQSSNSKLRSKKRRFEDDVEIPEDSAFNEEDEIKYGHFFSSPVDSSVFVKKKKKEPQSDLGELWNYIFEDDKQPQKPKQTSSKATDPKSSKSRDSVVALDDEDEPFNRLEEDTDLFASELLNDFDTDSFKWITEAPSSDVKYRKLVEKFREIEDNLPAILQPDSQTRTTREQRKLLYEKLRKQIGAKWGPMLAAIRRRSTPIVYGDDGGRTDNTIGGLSASFEPVTELEKDLNSLQNRALEKALMARQQQKQKRINRIKSKKWHKRQRERDLHVAAKILEKSDDPEVTRQLLESFEQKRAEKRLLRKKQSQSKWAKLALRYGGTQVLKQVSEQNQLLKGEQAFINDIVNQHKEASDTSDESSGSESSDDEETNVKPNIAEFFEILKNPPESVPQKGIFGFKFMQDALERKRLNIGQNDIAKHENEDFDELIKDKSDDEKSENEEKQLQLPTVSDADIEKAKAEIEARMAADEGGLTSDDEDVVVVTEQTKTVQKMPDPKSIIAKPQNALDEDLRLPNLIKDIQAPIKEDTIKLAQKLFVVRPDEENYIDDGSDDEDDEKGDKVKGIDVSKMPGWGSWTGYMLQESKVEEPIKKKKTIDRVKISKKKDQKLSKYYIHNVCLCQKCHDTLQLPHPYNNKQEYNVNMNTLLGPEFNTLTTHKKLVQPRVRRKTKMAFLGFCQNWSGDFTP